jgi:hypothetical protein
VGSLVRLSATLICGKARAQYLASSVWMEGQAGKDRDVVRKSEISLDRLELHARVNRELEAREQLPEYLEHREGVVTTIIDENFGVLKDNTSGRQVLFDTCDLWVSTVSTAAAAQQSLGSTTRVGEAVQFHAVLVQASGPAPYLATAVWRKEDRESGVFPAGQVPVALRREAIHEDKIRIYRTVSRSPALTSARRPSTPGLQGARGGMLVSTLGKVKTILNNSFGLIQFQLESSLQPEFCLFDTFDLYLEGGKTAARSELTVANCLTLGMEVRQWMVIIKMLCLR